MPQSCSRPGLATPASTTRDYIIDSGASVNLIARKLLSEAEWSKRKRLAVPLVLRTANSKVIATHTTEVYIKDVDMSMKFYILEDTPSVVSLGVLCKIYGFALFWKGNSPPILITPKLSLIHI